MPTPGSGAISMNDMRSNINRATSSSISMSEMRDRYGGSGSISFSDLRNAEGFTINPARYYTSSKFFTANNDGWSAGGFGGTYGSVSPNESNGMIQIAANSFIAYLSADNLYNGAQTSLGFFQTNDPANYDDGNGNTITSGYKGGNVTRLVIGNTAQSILGSSNTYTTVSYDMPTSGTLHCLVKF